MRNTKDKVEYQKLNAITGDSKFLYYQLRQSMEKAEQIDIIVSFLMESGVKLIIKDIKRAVERGVKVRILTGNYLNITQPQALYMLKRELGENVDLRFYNIPKTSFHPKAYIFHSKENSELFIGSSNMSYGALTSSIEWNYRLVKKENEFDFIKFCTEFDRLFEHYATVVTDEVMKEYSETWKRPKVYKDIEQCEKEQESVEFSTGAIDKIDKERDVVDNEGNAADYTEYLPNVIVNEIEGEKRTIFEPTGAQIEALYSLERSRKEGFEKGIVVAATGIGKTYLAAFDSSKYETVLFVAHRIEILKQAAKSFQNVRECKEVGFFYADVKETNKKVVFALVQTLGKKEYLCNEYFKADYFDYVVIDEFHHATATNYQNILEYFKPKFLLGLTATPERMDAKNIFELCDFNKVYEVRLQEAIEKGWLVPFRYYGIFDDTINYDNVKFSFGKYDEKELEVALMLHKRCDLIYKHYMKYGSKRALGFCTSRLHAEYMAKTFCEYGIKAAAVYSGENGEFSMERERAIEQLRSGELNVLFSVDMFNEGLDIPEVDLVMFLRPTQSPTVFLQQLGRGLRKADGKEFVNVLDFIGNYKKANLVPFFLSGKQYSSIASKQNNQADYEFPEDCYVEFDFQLIDLFKEQASKTMKVKDLIAEQFVIVERELGHRPSRMEYFTYMEDDVYEMAKANSAKNPFRN